MQPRPTNLFRDAFKLGLTWATLVNQHALSKLRCGYIVLGHLEGRRTRAKIQHCIFCDRRYTAILFHAICRCPETAEARAGLVSAGVDCSNTSFLGTHPADLAYSCIAAFAAIIAERATAFWRGSS